MSEVHHDNNATEALERPRRYTVRRRVATTVVAALTTISIGTLAEAGDITKVPSACNGKSGQNMTDCITDVPHPSSMDVPVQPPETHLPVDFVPEQLQ